MITPAHEQRNRLREYIDGANLQSVEPTHGERQRIAVIRAAQRQHDDIRAKYDAASDSTEFANYWANVDSYDADSANSIAVRRKMVPRARYEVANNGYADGIVQTHANFVVGLGPQLRVKTGDSARDTEIEKAFRSWSKAVQLRRKLWCAAHAKTQDGEAVALVVQNRAVAHPVKLDIVLVETEQLTTPYLPYREPGVIDGIRFDDFGNPYEYDILPYHPGGQWAAFYQQPSTFKAQYVCHWFQMRRPGQHRGIPELKSTLQAGASSRRWREATVSAAETAASFAALLETDMPPGSADLAAPFSAVEIERRMMAALPMGWKAQQMQADHPNATYDAFNRAQIGEQARPKNMPYNMAACDSSQASYASGRLDFQPYFAGVDIERADCEDLVLDVILRQWWKEASLVYGWGSPLEPPDPYWDWTNHPVADLSAEANATDTKLRNGTITPQQVYAEAGEDFDEALEAMATAYGVTVDQMREILRYSVFNGTNQLASIKQAQAQQTQAAANAASTAGGVAR